MLLFWDRFSVSKPLSQIQRRTLLFLQQASYTPSFGGLGLNLTRAVLDGQLKYKDPFTENTRKFVYCEDMAVVTWASDAARREFQGLPPDTKSFECEIMDWADDIAYAVHDLEDSIHVKLIDQSTFSKDDPRTRDAINEVQGCGKYKGINVRPIAKELFDIIHPSFPAAASYHEQKASRKELTSGLIGRYIKSATRCDRNVVSNNPISYRYLHSVKIPDKHQVEVDLIQKLVRKSAIESSPVRTLEEKGRHIVRCLFRKYMQDKGEQLLPNDWRELLEGDEKARVICDYISGMTDDYAQRTHAKLFLPN